jgi:DNA mismatch repair protein MSH6
LECVPATKTPSSKKARRTIVDDDDGDDDDYEAADPAVITGSTRKRRADDDADGGRAAASADNPVTPRVAAGRDSLSSRFARGSRPSVAPSLSAGARRRESALSLPDDDDAGGSVEKGASGVYACGAHIHDTEPAYAFLSDAAQRRDAAGKPRDHAAFDSRTMALPAEWERLKLSEVQQQWWRLKASFHDCVLFFKIGKFYELYHTDSDTAVREAGLVYMKGAQAHSGFPEISYGKYVEALVAKGYKVARVEQTETPDGSKARIQKHKEDHKAGKRKAPTKADQAMRREVRCGVLPRRRRRGRPTRVSRCVR